MSDPRPAHAHDLAPVRAGMAHLHASGWTQRLVWFLRAMAVLSLLKGLSHWAAVCGFGFAPAGGFEAQSLAWQTATVFFAVIDMVASVGLWLAAPWGAVVWLTASVSMIVVETFFPQIYGDFWIVIVTEPLMIFAYLALAIQAAREQPQ